MKHAKTCYGKCGPMADQAPRRAVGRALRRLARAGYRTQAAQADCSECAFGRFGETPSAWVFYHQQGRDSAFDCSGFGIADQDDPQLHLYWGNPAGDPGEIVAALTAEGLAANGSTPKKSVVVLIPKASQA